jgi:hypothetical protein
MKITGLLGCDAVQFGESLTFRMNISLPSSRSKSNPNGLACRLPLLVSYLAYSSAFKKIFFSETLGSLRTTRRITTQKFAFFIISGVIISDANNIKHIHDKSMLKVSVRRTVVV